MGSWQKRLDVNHNENNFDFLRLAAATMVLVSHQHALMGMAEPGLTGLYSLGEFGVCVFFVISGFLVTQSWLRDPHVLRFLAKRLLRIWPGLFAVTCVAALVVGPIVSDLDVRRYFSSPELREYFSSLELTHIDFALPGVFAHNPFPTTVNGSLWTIALEVHWYLLLAIAGLVGALRWRWMALCGIVAFAVYHFGVYHAETNPVRIHSREYGLFFLAGALLQLFRDGWVGRRALLVAGSLAIGAVLFATGWHVLAVLVSLPCLVIVTGETSTPFLRRFGRLGDLSYGVYVYAFMAQQTLVWKLGASGSFALDLLATIVVTFICAWLSWHLVEKRALSFKPAGLRSISKTYPATRLANLP